MPKSVGKFLAIALFVCISVAHAQAADQKKKTPEILPDPPAEVFSPASIPSYMLHSTYKVRTKSMIGEYEAEWGGSAWGVDLKPFGFEGKHYLVTAAHVVLDDEDQTVTFRRVEYPFEETIQKIYEIQELDNFLGDRLRDGR